MCGCIPQEGSNAVWCRHYLTSKYVSILCCTDSMLWHEHASMSLASCLNFMDKKITIAKIQLLTAAVDGFVSL